jgi:hypothetical protein
MLLLNAEIQTMASKMNCERALNRYEEMLGTLDHVVGLGIVPAEQPAGKEYAIAVYVADRKVPGKIASIPKSLHLPSKKGDVLVPIRVIEQGPIAKETL